MPTTSATPSTPRSTPSSISNSSSKSVYIPRPDGLTGTWMTTHWYTCGTDMCVDVHLITPDGKFRIVKAAVDLKPIVRRVVDYHRKRLHEDGGAPSVNGCIPIEVGFFGSFGKSISRSVKSIGRNKLIKSISRSVKAVAKAPLTLSKPALTLARNVPGLGNVSRAGLAATAIVDRATRGKLPSTRQLGRLGKYGALTAADYFAPGSGMAASSIMAQAAPLLKTATMIPKVSNETLGTYRMAQNMVDSMARAKGIQQSARAMVAQQRMPAVVRGLAQKALRVKQAQAQLYKLPAARQAQAASRLAGIQNQIRNQAVRLKRAQGAINRKAALGRQLPAQTARQTMLKARAAENFTRKVLAARHSSNPVVRNRAAQAAAILSRVARSRQRLQAIAAGAYPGMNVSGLSVGCADNPNCNC